MIDDTPLTELIGTQKLPAEDWEAMKVRVIQGGKHIIDLRGRSSFQSRRVLSRAASVLTCEGLRPE